MIEKRIKRIIQVGSSKGITLDNKLLKKLKKNKGDFVELTIR